MAGILIVGPLLEAHLLGVEVKGCVLVLNDNRHVGKNHSCSNRKATQARGEPEVQPVIGSMRVLSYNDFCIHADLPPGGRMNCVSWYPLFVEPLKLILFSLYEFNDSLFLYLSQKG